MLVFDAVATNAITHSHNQTFKNLLDAEFLLDVLGKGVLVDEDVHGLVADEGLAGVEHAVEFAIVAPAVLDDVVFVAHLVLGGAVDKHAVVVGGLTVVIGHLTFFLGDPTLGGGVLGSLVLDILGLHAGPVGHVATHNGRDFGGGEHAETLAGAHAEALLAHVGAPGYGVAVGDGVVENLHHLVERHVVALSMTPVVLNLEGELLIEGMMGVGGDAHIVVGEEMTILQSPAEFHFVGDSKVLICGIFQSFNLWGFGFKRWVIRLILGFKLWGIRF